MKELENELEAIIELLYQEKVATANNKLLNILSGLANYVEALMDMKKKQEMLNSLNEAVGAMEQGDYTLLADILQYDIMEKMRKG